MYGRKPLKNLRLAVNRQQRKIQIGGRIGGEKIRHPNPHVGISGKFRPSFRNPGQRAHIIAVHAEYDWVVPNARPCAFLVLQGIRHGIRFLRKIRNESAHGSAFPHDAAVCKHHVRLGLGALFFQTRRQLVARHRYEPDADLFCLFIFGSQQARLLRRHGRINRHRPLRGRRRAVGVPGKERDADHRAEYEHEG